MALKEESGVEKALRIMSAGKKYHTEPSSESGGEIRPGVRKALAVMRGYDEEESAPELSTMEKAGQVARGIPATYGAIGDLISAGGQALAKPVQAPLYESLSRISNNPEELTSPEQYHQNISEQRPMSETLPEQTIDRLYGKNLAPTDNAGRFRQGVGEFLAPLPVPGGGALIQAAKVGAKPLAKMAAKEASIAAGASAGLHLTPRMTEEGTIPGAAEDMLKTIVGGVAGGKTLGAAKGAAKIAASPIESASKGTSKLSAKLFGKDANKEVFDLAKKHDIELPFNVGLNSKSANFTANNAFKSVYTSEKYKKALQKSSDSMINSVKKSIDTLGEGNPLQHEASVGFANHLREEEKIFKGQSDKLYESARKSLSPKDMVIPKNTAKALQSPAVEELLNTVSPSAGEKQVINRIKEIQSKLVKQDKLSDKFLEQYGHKPDLVKTAKKQLGKRVNEAPVTDLINLRKSLLNTLNYETDIRGSEAFLSKLVNTLDSDIKNIGNKDFLGKYEAANSFFRQNIGQRFRKSIAQSIMKNEAPADAFNLMNSVSNIKRLEKIAGESPKSAEIFNSLKKAKVRQIIGSAVEGDLKKEGSLKTGQFANLFDSTNKERNQEMLQYLLGKKEYQNLEEIAKISREFQKSGRELLNTSGTAHVLSDINATKEAVHAAVQTIASIAGGSALGGIKGLGAASFAIGAPWALSRLVSNPKFVSQMRQYATAKKAGRVKYADNVLLKKLLITATHDIDEGLKEKESKKE